MPLNPPALVRLKGTFGTKTTTVVLTFDEALEAVKEGKNVCAPNTVTPLTEDQIQRNFTAKQQFVLVEKVQLEERQETFRGETFVFRPNPKYGNEPIVEVHSTWPLSAMLAIPELYEQATDWERERNAESDRAWFKELGFVTKEEVEEMIGKKRPAKKATKSEE